MARIRSPLSCSVFRVLLYWYLMFLLLENNPTFIKTSHSGGGGNGGGGTFNEKEGGMGAPSLPCSLIICSGPLFYPTVLFFFSVLFPIHLFLPPVPSHRVIPFLRAGPFYLFLPPVLSHRVVPFLCVVPYSSVPTPCTIAPCYSFPPCCSLFSIHLFLPPALSHRVVPFLCAVPY